VLRRAPESAPDQPSTRLRNEGLPIQPFSPHFQGESIKSIQNKRNKLKIWSTAENDAFDGRFGFAGAIAALPSLLRRRWIASGPPFGVAIATNLRSGAWLPLESSLCQIHRP
jgi:hypothetical protein